MHKPESGGCLSNLASVLCHTKVQLVAVIVWILGFAFFVVGKWTIKDQTAFNLVGSSVALTSVLLPILAILLAMESPPFKAYRSMKASSAGNIYHLTDQSWSPKMNTLVIHAGLLDEALCTLTAIQPVLDAFVLPRLTEFLTYQPLAMVKGLIKYQREYRGAIRELMRDIARVQAYAPSANPEQRSLWTSEGRQNLVRWLRTSEGRHLVRRLLLAEVGSMAKSWLAFHLCISWPRSWPSLRS